MHSKLFFCDLELSSRHQLAEWQKLLWKSWVWGLLVSLLKAHQERYRIIREDAFLDFYDDSNSHILQALWGAMMSKVTEVANFLPVSDVKCAQKGTGETGHGNTLSVSYSLYRTPFPPLPLSQTALPTVR